MERLPSWLAHDLDELQERNLLRQRHVVEHRTPGHIVVDGREYVDFSSNDYLGLASDPRIAGAVAEYLAEQVWGAAASPLVTGYHRVHEELERELAAFEGVESVLLFGSGYAANVGVISALVTPQDVIFCDKRNHASLIDGSRLSGGKLQVYRTDRLEQLERRLASVTGYRQRWIITDSVFSMDGDCAPLVELCDLAHRFDAILYVDEAHATGVLGERGRGLAEQLGVEGRIPLRMGTLSKALGSVGGFLATTSVWSEWLLNHARSYIYSTALPPACARAALEALRLMAREPWRRQQALANGELLRTRLSERGWDTGASVTPIVPVLLGDPVNALTLATRLRSLGHWATAIRPPTVATGTSRLRLSLSAAHTPHEIEALLAAIDNPMAH